MLKKTLLILSAGLVLPLSYTTKVWAQTQTSGAVSGSVTEKQSGQALQGVTVIITSMTRKNKQTAISDPQGSFTFESLIPGDYSLVFLYGDAQTVIPKVHINSARTAQVRAQIDSKSSEVVTIKATPPPIDILTTKKSIVLDRNFLKNAPIGRSIGGALSTLSGTTTDDDGNISFGGSTANENSYNIDGLNTSNVNTGRIGNNISKYFVEELEVITSGYGAEYGRSSGAQVNAVTRSGTNEFTGSVAIDYTNGALSSLAAPARFPGLITTQSQLARDFALTATLGGPIVKDKLWFFVGVEPRASSTNNTRTYSQAVDCHKILPSGQLSECKIGTEAEGGYSDGIRDRNLLDDEIFREVDSVTIPTSDQSYNFLAKINYAAGPNHIGNFSFNGGPNFRDRLSGDGELQAIKLQTQAFPITVNTQWTSKFNDSSTVISAIAGYYQQATNDSSFDSKASSLVQQYITLISPNDQNFLPLITGINQFTGQRREPQAFIDACQDGTPEDLFPEIRNCPFQGTYAVGGPGALNNFTEQRTSGKLTISQRFQAAGKHVVKAGADVISNGFADRRAFSGGAAISTLAQPPGDVVTSVTRYISLANPTRDLSLYPDLCDRFAEDGMGSACSLTPLGATKNRSIDLSAFVQDSWRIRDNITLNLGLRYEEQRMRSPSDLVGTTDANNNVVGKNALVLRDMWAPRLGATYDWTKEGRSKISASWGRYYTALPLGIIGSTFGGERRTQSSDFNATQCGTESPDDLPLIDNLINRPDGRACLVNNGNNALIRESVEGGTSSILVVDNAKAQFVDETTLGIDYEIIEGVVLALSYTNKVLKRTLDNISTDGGQNFVLGNPGEWSTKDERALLERINNETDSAQKQQLEESLEQFRGIRLYDKARRHFNSLTASVSAPLSEQLSIQANYIFSSTRGNFGDTGLGALQFSRAFDARLNMQNAYGELQQDRRHQVGLNAIYRQNLKKFGSLTTGVNVLVSSGAPVEIIGSNLGSDRDLSDNFLLSRGSFGNGPIQYSSSVRTSYEYQLSNGMGVSFYSELRNIQAFGIFAGRQNYTIESKYTEDPSGLIIGSRIEDLLYLKALDSSSESEPEVPVTARRNARFLLPVDFAGRVIVPAINVGARLEF